MKRCFPVIAAAALIFSLSPTARAADPSSGTLTDTSGPLKYTAGPFMVANPTPLLLVDSGPECNNPVQPCDDFALTVALPSDFADKNPGDLIQFTMGWVDAGTGQSDYDLYVYEGTVTNTDGSQQATTQSASKANPEVTTLRVFNGTKTFTVKVVPFQPTGETVNVEIELIKGAGGGGGSPAAFGQATPTAPGVPRYQNFFPPKGSAANAGNGEFSIGFDPKSGNIMTTSTFDLGGIHVFRVTPPEKLNPPLPEAGPATWTEVSPIELKAPPPIGDVILFTDQASGRTFTSNFFNGVGTTAEFAFSDDDGATWLPGSGPPNGGEDHPTVGGGPYPAGSPFAQIAQAAGFSNAVYYCSQDIVGPAACQRSDDGGVTFNSGVPIYEGNGVTDCNGLHGHVKVGPDGAAYVPVPNCGDQQGGVVSLDAGLTWTEYKIPGSQSFAGGSTDPSVAVGADNIVYECYVDGQGAEHHVHVAVSTDHGATWGNDTDIGAPAGVIMAVFPAVVAGSPGRAACGFVGSDVAGNHESLDYPGFWYLFIAATYDGGKTWTTVNATPNDPVQGAGGIWNSGGNNLNRNLLDFDDATLDDKGRVLYGYDDGCVSDKCLADPTKNDFVAFERVARQTGGETLFASEDPNTDTSVAKPPEAPFLAGTRAAAKAELSWNAPDNGGSDITQYKVLRGTAAGGESQIATVSGAKTQFTDATVDAATPKFFYQVVAVNSQGESMPSNEVALESMPVEDVCTAPGLTTLTDASGDSSTGTPGTDLKSFQLAQPFAMDGNVELRFQLNTDPGQNPQPPDSYWYVSFNTPDPMDATKTIVRGVRMWFDPGNPAVPTFQSYIAAPNNSGGVDGRFVQSGSEKPADPKSVYDFANGTIVIVVPINDLGLKAGDTITGFNSASVQAVSIPGDGGAAATVDEMPDGLGRQGSFIVNANATCAPNNPPLAVLTTDVAGGPAPLTVKFDGSGSSDPDAGDTVASYTFDFGDGSQAVTQSTPSVSHIYQQAGNFRATLSVTDSRGKSNENVASVMIEVQQAPPPPSGGNQPPTAALAADPLRGAAPLDVNFDASGSSDPDGDALSYTFNFGDGSSEVSGTNPKASHTYDKNGSFSASVVVTDARGATASKAVGITVQSGGTTGPQPPVASLAVSPSSGPAPLTVNFDASGSQDPDGDAIASYTFDFGDGNPAVTQTAPTVSHVYTTAGTFIASVTVKDSAGDASDPVLMTIPVSTPTVSTPTAVIPRGGGGALGVLTLLPLLGVGLARRRRH